MIHRTIITHNVTRTTVEFLIQHPRSMFCTSSPAYQTFGQTRKSDNATNLEWITNLFGDDLNTPNFATSYLAYLQQFIAPYSFGEQGQSSLVVTTHTENPETEQQHHHHEGEPVIQKKEIHDVINVHRPVGLVIILVIKV